MKIERLHKIGFSLILLQPKRKQPLDDGWSKGPKVALFDILEGIDAGCNLGFRPGITSKTQDGKYILGIDLDIRVAEDKEEAIAKLEELFGRKFLKQCARVISGSGGESRHFYFLMNRPMRAKTVAHSKEKFFDEAKQKMRWRWEIEVFGEGKQMVLPPSIHPDTGKEYVWAKEPENLPVMEEEILEGIIDELSQAASNFDDADLAPLGISYDDAEDILSKLDRQKWFVEREGWRSVGMALHHEFGGHKDAYRLWVKYSKEEKNFDAREQRYQWGTFGRNTQVRPIRMATLMKEAAEAEIRDVLQPTDSDAEELREAIRNEKARKEMLAARRPNPLQKKKSKLKINQPDHLMTVPGILGEIVEVYNRSAPRPQPQFAPHVALAYGSVILGRNFVTDMGNYSSLYFLMLGKTASGKEHGLKVIESIMEQCELELVGPPRYTSDAGLMSALEFRPKHISLADEFSRYLKSARTSGDANMSNAQSALMEIWGRLGGTHRNKGYSARGMSKAQMEEMASSHVKRPALTMLGVAVPDDFYNAISGDDVASGFLNRFLICETELPRLPMQSNPSPIKVNQRIRKWSRDNAFPVVGDDEDIMDAINRNDPAQPGDPVEIPFTPRAKRLLTELDTMAIEKMDSLDSRGLDGLYGRAREIIMRLSLIVAVSCEKEEISVEHVEWSRDYFMYHAEKLENRTTDIGVSPVQAVVKEAYKKIQEAAEDGSKGITARELTVQLWSFRNMSSRDREEVIRLLASDYGVVFRAMKRNSSRKRTKMLTILEEE